MKIYAWLYNKRCNLFLKKKSGKCAGCVPVAPLPLGKVESRLQRHLLSDSHRKRAGTNHSAIISISQTLHSALGLLGFPWRKTAGFIWSVWLSGTEGHLCWELTGGRRAAADGAPKSSSSRVPQTQRVCRSIGDAERKE